MELIFALFALALAIWVKRQQNRLESEIASLRSSLVSVEDQLNGLQPRPDGKAAQASRPNPKRVEKPEAEGPQKSAAAVPPREQVANPAPPVVQPRPRRSLADLENAIGAKWSVLLGGLAVALGAVFLVKYSIEAGLLGPRARIASGAIFSAALFAGGEWLRRRDNRFSLPAIPSADIPGIITGVGAIAAFATIYAAYALYGFLGAASAFVLLTIAGLASLLLSSIHGPKLAAIGVLGSYATPLLVSSDAPNPLALAIHVLVVTATVMGMARIRNWLWLALAGVAGGAIWTVLGANIDGVMSGIAGFLMAGGLTAMAAVALGWQKADMPVPPQDRGIDQGAVIAFAAFAFAAMAQIALNQHLPLIATALTVSLIMTASAVVWPSFAVIAMGGAIVTLFALGKVDLTLAYQPGIMTWEMVTEGLVPLDILAYVRKTLLLAVPVVVLAVYGSLRYGAQARSSAGWLATAAGVTVFLGLVVTYLRVAPFETRLTFGAAGLAAAFGAAVLVDRFNRLDPEDLQAPAPAAYAVTSAATLSFALAVSLDAGLMPIAFCLAALGIAWIYTWRPLNVLPKLAIAAAVLGSVSLFYPLGVDSAAIGTTPLLNRLVLIAGLPAAALVVASELIRRAGKDFESAILGAFGLALSALFVSLEIRHWFSGGSIAYHGMNLAENATQALAALAFSAGLQRAASATRAAFYANASLIAGVISAAMIALGLLILNNPVFTDESVGATPVLNLLLLSYFLTGLTAAAVALYARPVRPRWFTLGFAALAGVLLFAFVSLSVRHGFKGANLGLFRSTSDAEFWVYSVAWLALGSLVLALGLWLKSFPVRAASAILIILTIVKVFLLDLSELEGALRALSFIGLGLALLAIGRFYQRVLLRQAASGPGDDENPVPEPGGSPGN
ncbi:MAG: DUF2339 domain-containing protein [Rhizobiaceae bacterium]